MTYTQLAMTAVALAVVIDLFLLRVRLLRRAAFWTAYAIVVGFQLVTNGWLTGREIVTYDPTTIVGSGAVVAIGEGRIAFAPVEDLLFGFVLVLFALDWWVWWGRRGLDREPYAYGPWARRHRPWLTDGSRTARDRRATTARR